MELGVRIGELERKLNARNFEQQKWGDKQDSTCKDA